MPALRCLQTSTTERLATGLRCAVAWLVLLSLTAAGCVPVRNPPVSASSPPRRVSYPGFPSLYVPPRTITIWLPTGYDAGNRHYAVLYMHDGQNLFDPGAAMGGEPWAVDTHLQGLIQAGRVRDTIIVGIDNTPSARWREYAPFAAFTALTPELQQLAIGANSGPPVSEEYLRFIVEELKPFVDRTYRTRADRANTFIMGSSMGGLISLYALTRYPGTFGGAGCLSTHWSYTTNPAVLADAQTPEASRIAGAYIDWLEQHLPDPATHRIYFDHGTEFLDALYGPYQSRVDKLMIARGYRAGIDFESRVFAGATHNERAWRERVDIPLVFLLAN